MVCSSPHLRADRGSVERSCWYLYGVRAFSRIGHFVPDDKDAPGFWPCGDVEVSVLGSDDYKQASKKMMEKLRDSVCDQTVSGYSSTGAGCFCTGCCIESKRI